MDAVGLSNATVATWGHRRLPVAKLALVGVGVVIVVLLVVSVALHSGGSADTLAFGNSTRTVQRGAGPSVTPTTAAVATTGAYPTTISGAQSQMAAINALLDQSAAVRSEVQPAAAAIAECTNSSAVASAIEALNQVASTRQQLLVQLGSLVVGQIPGGPQLVATLQSAWQASIQSDQSYAAAGTDVQNGGGCGLNDSNFQSAQGTDAEATTAKQSFVAAWNPLAAQYGFPPRDQASI